MGDSANRLVLFDYPGCDQEAATPGWLGSSQAGGKRTATAQGTAAVNARLKGQPGGLGNPKSVARWRFFVETDIDVKHY